MDRRQVLDVFTRDTLEACIEGMSLDREMGKAKPAVQGLSIDGKQTTTIGQRQQSHEKNSFSIQKNKPRETRDRCRDNSPQIGRDNSPQIGKDNSPQIGRDNSSQIGRDNSSQISRDRENRKHEPG
jgi:hypothetical protein